MATRSTCLLVETEFRTLLEALHGYLLRDRSAEDPAACEECVQGLDRPQCEALHRRLQRLHADCRLLLQDMHTLEDASDTPASDPAFEHAGGASTPRTSL
ncbi:MAG: hypothetical protein ACOCZK_05825 [Planctomycetota bacterium]